MDKTSANLRPTKQRMDFAPRSHAGARILKPFTQSVDLKTPVKSAVNSPKTLAKPITASPKLPANSATVSPKAQSAKTISSRPQVFKRTFSDIRTAKSHTFASSARAIVNAKKSTSPSAPKSAATLHHAATQPAPEKQRVSPANLLTKHQSRPPKHLAASTDPLVQRHDSGLKIRTTSTKQTIMPSVQPRPSHTSYTPMPPAETPMPEPISPDAATTRAAKPDHQADSTPSASHQSLGSKSPFFLQSVNVEKRPLSSGSPLRRFTKMNDNKSSNAKKSTPKPPKPEKPVMPTIVVPDSHRSKTPIFILLIFTIILGILVGAAAYLFFFQ